MLPKAHSVDILVQQCYPQQPGDTNWGDGNIREFAIKTQENTLHAPDVAYVPQPVGESELRAKYFAWDVLI